jgi:hypothetical protein
VSDGDEVAAAPAYSWGGIRVTALAFTPDGRQLVAVTGNGIVRFWRLPD